MVREGRNCAQNDDDVALFQHLCCLENKEHASDLIDQDDICAFNTHDEEIHFLLSRGSSFLPPEVVLILIELARNLGYDAAYDAVKYVISRIILLVVKKKPDECPTRFEVACNIRNSQ